jgi:hypothetical protein
LPKVPATPKKTLSISTGFYKAPQPIARHPAAQPALPIGRTIR